MSYELQPEVRPCRPLSYFDDNFVAPLASMEDLSILMTPMSTPGPTPGPSPKSRARWSHRLSSGNQFEPLPPINDDTVLEFPIQNGGGHSTENSFPRPQNLLRKSIANNRRNYPACPCMLSEEGESQRKTPSSSSPPTQVEKQKDFRTSPVIVNGQDWNVEENDLQKRNYFGAKKVPTVNRFASPAWRPRDVIDDPDERRRMLDDSDFPFIRPRDVIPCDEDKRRILDEDDSQSPFVRPRQVHFLPSPRNQRNNSRLSSPVVRRESGGGVTPQSSSRSSPEFSSLIRNNGGSLEPAAMKPPTDRFWLTCNKD